VRPGRAPARGSHADGEAPATPDGERRHLTVLFCDLVDSTPLSGELDPEDLAGVLRAYHAVCGQVIARFEGHVARIVGDGLLVYFGYPYAHEDDAQRALRAGLGIVAALAQLNARLERERGLRLAVRLGVNSGLVVIGEMRSGTERDPVAVTGATPNIAARLQSLAAANSVVISAATYRLVQGYFACDDLGAQALKGVPQPVRVYRVRAESGARSRLEAAAVESGPGLTPLVGRQHELAVLHERWTQTREGGGHVVVLIGEAGIGKSRLAQTLAARVAAEPDAWLTPLQCSPYLQQSAFAPWVALLERVVLQLDHDAPPAAKLRTLEGWLTEYGLPLAETVPLLAGLLGIPGAAVDERYPPLPLPPEQQRQKLLELVLGILAQRAARQPVLLLVEDLHWADPSTVELLDLLVNQPPTTRLLALFTCRPEFVVPWTGRAHVTLLTLARLPQAQTAALVTAVAGGHPLPEDVAAQIVAKTDGVPLFVEELTKTVLESGLVHEIQGAYALAGPLPPLAIPATLQDSLLARLDRLAAIREVAQLAATVGREFPYAVLQPVAAAIGVEESTLREALGKLVAAELVYQRGLPPRATYLFKHALVRDAAYESLLRSRRQQFHRLIAETLAARFPETVEQQPEIVAQHCAAAGLGWEASAYWLRAGQRALARPADREAVAHLRQGLEVLRTLPETPDRARRELPLLLALSVALRRIRGFTAPELREVYTRARALCEQLGDEVQLLPVLYGLFTFEYIGADLSTGREQAIRLLALAERLHDSAATVEGYRSVGSTLYVLGELVEARRHLEASLARYDPERHRSSALRFGQDPRVLALGFSAYVLWHLGYPIQALKQVAASLAWAEELAHPFAKAYALVFGVGVSVCLRDGAGLQTYVTPLLEIGEQFGFVVFSAWGRIAQGRALALQGSPGAGIAQIRQTLDAFERMNMRLQLTFMYAVLADVYLADRRYAEGQAALDRAQLLMAERGERFWEPEVHRLRGVLRLVDEAADRHDRHDQAEAAFRQALAVARHQQARSLELRATTSLARLWQQQGRRREAHDLLAPIYGWFTEGFDTADLREAKSLLEELR
jgi:class 3 adenylate cyclase/predicted ATPase